MCDTTEVTRGAVTRGFQLSLESGDVNYFSLGRNTSPG